MASSIHVRLDASEAILMKKETLLLEQSLLQAVAHIREYNLLRKKEFSIKNQIKKDMGSLYNLIISMESNLPREDIVHFTKKSHIKAPLRMQKIVKERTFISKGKPKNELANEIEEIRQKLARLG